jgi:hypothetical protein
MLAGPVWLFRTESIADKATGVIGTALLLPCIFAVGVWRNAGTFLLAIFAILCWLGAGLWIEAIASV